MRRHLLHATLALSLAASTPALAGPCGGQGACQGSCRPQAEAPAVAAAEVTPDGNMPRSAIPEKYRWNLKPLLPDAQAFEAGLVEAAAGRQRLQSYRGSLARPDRMTACLEEYFRTRLLTNRLTLFAALSLETDLQNTDLQARNDRALAAMNDLMSGAGFLRQEILDLDEAALSRAYREQPSLLRYRGWIQEIRRRRNHVLPAEQERLLAQAGDNQFAEIDLNELPSDFEKTFKALMADLRLPTVKDESGREVQLTFSNYGKYRASEDRRVRRDTVESFFATLNDYRHAFAATLAGQVNFSTFLARARGYASPLQAYLDRDNIDPAVYRNLVSTVRANTAPLHRYVRLRKKLMGLDEIRLFDLYTPMVAGGKRKVTYEQARAVLPEALAPLGQDYLAVLRQGLEPSQGWVDVYPHKDKDSGASSSSVFGVHPFVKMNYYDESDDMSTLAHEFGHALHSHLSSSTQPYATAGYVPFVAEVASTCNEKLLSDYLVANAADDHERLFLLNEMVDRIRTTIYRQTLFADFELRVHEAAAQGTPITADFLDSTYRNLVQDYYGPDFTLGPNDGIEWAYVPHLYYKFYVFSYATGLSSGIALAEKIQTEGEPARRAYLAMLSGGSSKPPLELLKGAGVDLTRPEPIQAATQEMDRILTEMERIVARTSR